MDKCSIEGCEKPLKTRGWCEMHYARWRRNGDMVVRKRQPVPMGLRPRCSVVGCDKLSLARTWCRSHYEIWKRWGDPLAGPGRGQFAVPLETRLPKFVKWDAATGCSVWMGYRNEKGYGVVGVNGSVMLAHRAVYELFKGPIPEGMTLDHLCANPPCVNPDHLEPVTAEENLRRGGLPHF